MTTSISGLSVVAIFCSLVLVSICMPLCRDNIPFSIKLAQSPLVVYGDIIETSTPLSVNNYTKSFNITFLVRCTLKGISPTHENILIEHTPPDNPLCYRTLVNGHTYVYFLNRTQSNNYFQQLPFHELPFTDDATVEVLKRTCGIQTRPFREIIKTNDNEIDTQCPIVSFGCGQML